MGEPMKLNIKGAQPDMQAIAKDSCIDFANKAVKPSIQALAREAETVPESGYLNPNFNPNLPTVNQCQVPSWAMHIECPHCNEQLENWLINPEHSIQTCSTCGKQFNVSRDIAMEIT